MKRLRKEIALMFALVSILYDSKLGVTYVLTDVNGNLKVIISEDYLYRIRDSIVNYKIFKQKKAVLPVTSNSWQKTYTELYFKTTDYFDPRDISVELYYARVGTLLSLGRSRKMVANYEFRKWVARDVEAYASSTFLIQEAIDYLKSCGADSSMH